MFFKGSMIIFLWCDEVANLKKLSFMHFYYKSFQIWTYNIYLSLNETFQQILWWT